MLALVAAGALAIDVTNLMMYRSMLSDAADNAVLAAVSEGSRTRRYAYTLIGDGIIPPGNEDIQTLFDINFIGVKEERLKFLNVTPDARREGYKIVAGISYNARVKTFFGSILGVEYVFLESSAKAEWQARDSADYYLALDNTGSMGLGATTSDVNLLVNNIGCQFACHIAPESSFDPNENTLTKARELGATLRFDVVRQASENLFDTAEKMRFFMDQYRMALFDFGPKGSMQGLTELQPLTNDLQVAKVSLDKYQLMQYEDSYGDRQTHLINFFEQLNQAIPEPEISSTGFKRQQYVFFVSDGVHNAFPPNTVTGAGCRGVYPVGFAPWPLRQRHCITPIDPASCQAIKDRGVKIAVLYTVYQPIITTGTNNWDQWMYKWAGPGANGGGDLIARDMQACASDDLFFAVGPNEGISEAMEELFRRTQNDKPTLLP